MDYIETWQKSLNQQSQKNNVLNLIDEKIFNLSDKIIELNLLQIENSQGFNDRGLYNPNYKGVYSKATSQMGFAKGLFKPIGGLYDFKVTGKFKSGFEIIDKPTGFGIDSTGAYGSDGKTEFFEGYTNMFGLNTQNTTTIMDEVEYYVLDKILSNVYG